MCNIELNRVLAISQQMDSNGRSQMAVSLSVLACHSNHMNSSRCGNSRVCTPLVTPVPMLHGELLDDRKRCGGISLCHNMHHSKSGFECTSVNHNKYPHWRSWWIPMMVLYNTLELLTFHLFLTFVLFIYQLW